jgi:hypothetical protein
MTDPNPYRAPSDADLRPTNGDRVRATVLAVVLLDVTFSAGKVLWNLPDQLESPDSSAALIGGALVFWVAWMVAELFAARLIWQGREHDGDTQLSPSFG